MATHAAAHGDGAAGHTVETATGLSNAKLAMWAFLGSECLLFGALISTYVLYRGASTEGPFPRDVFDIPYTSISAFVLLMSSLTMVLALAAIQRGDERGLRIWLLATALLGSVFLGGQYYEFTSFYHEGMKLTGVNLFSSAFFTLTGFHGAHVTAGVIWLLSLLAIDVKRGLRPSDALNVDLAALYWHFVDVVWIAIFTLVYLIK